MDRRDDKTPQAGAGTMAYMLDIARLARPLAIDAPLSLWLVDLSAPPDAQAVGCLSDMECERAARFASPRHRNRYLNAHIAVRVLLEEHCGVAAHRQRFVLEADGKPQLANFPNWQFSLSYADDMALMGIDFDNRVGVDIETDRNLADADELSALHFHPKERDALAPLAPTLRQGVAFLQGWTRKEACLKALGCGLSMATTDIHSGISGQARVPIAGQVEIMVDSFTPMVGFTAAWARISTLPDDAGAVFQ
jgi:4'-phosphopantetheinyl transferase